MRAVKAEEVKAEEVNDTMSMEAANEVRFIFFSMGVAVDQLARREGLDQNGIMCTLFYLMHDFLAKEGIDVVKLEKKIQEGEI